MGNSPHGVGWWFALNVNSAFASFVGDWTLNYSDVSGSNRIKLPEGTLTAMLRSSVIRVASLFLAAALIADAETFAFAENAADEHASVALISQQGAIVPNQDLWVGLRFDLQDGWHTYWVNPGDSGEAPRVEWKLPAGFEAGDIQWPYPSRLSTPPFVDYGYAHQVLLMVPIRPVRGLKQGTRQMLSARVHYLVCRDVCIPGQKQLALTLPVETRATPGPDAKLFEVTRERLPQPAPASWKMSALSQGSIFRLRLRMGTLAPGPQFFPMDEEQIENAAAQRLTAIPGGVRLDLEKSRHLLKSISHLRGVLVTGSGKAYEVDIPVSPSSN